MLVRRWCQQERSFIVGGNGKWYTSFEKPVWWIPTKLNILLVHDPAIALLGIYLKELKTCFHIDTYTLMLIAAVFIMAQT